MTYRISLKNWNDNRSAFYYFFNWCMSQGPSNTVRDRLDISLKDYHAKISYIDGAGYVVFDSQDELTEFMLRWS